MKLTIIFTLFTPLFTLVTSAGEPTCKKNSDCVIWIDECELSSAKAKAALPADSISYTEQGTTLYAQKSDGMFCLKDFFVEPSITPNSAAKCIKGECVIYSPKKSL